VSKIIKISAETAARIRNLLDRLAKTSEDEESPADVKDEAQKLAAHMREAGVIKAADEQEFAKVLATHEGAMRVARRGIDLEIEHRKESAEEKQADDRRVPALGGGRKDYTPETSSVDRMKAAHDKFGETVLAAGGA